MFCFPDRTQSEGDSYNPVRHRRIGFLYPGISSDLSGETHTGDSALVLGMGLSVLSATMHRLNLFSDLLHADLCIAVCLSLPVERVHVFNSEPDERESDFQDACLACVVPCAGACTGGELDK